VTDSTADVRTFDRTTIALVVGDITAIPADAIVNAANSAFAAGGGVDGAIRAGAGPELSGEMRRRYPMGIPTGSAVSTGAYNLPARWVIHAVGPVWSGGGQDKLDLLRGAYRGVLAEASASAPGRSARPRSARARSASRLTRRPTSRSERWSTISWAIRRSSA
jgi:O-acetyl-ADP-ribose deacetylase (regulator of RNase III)